VPIVLDQGLATRLSDGGPALQIAIRVVNDATRRFEDLEALVFQIQGPAALHAAGRPTAEYQRAFAETFRRLLALRAAELSRAAVKALNERRLLGFALNARALLESAAVAAYYLARLKTALEAVPIDQNEVLTVLRMGLTGSRFDWRGLFRDPGAVDECVAAYASGAPQLVASPATNILTMLNALARRLEELQVGSGAQMHFAYALLSDVAHPAFGSHLVYFQTTEPLLSVGAEPADATLLGLSSIVLPRYALACSALEVCLDELLELASGLQ